MVMSHSIHKNICLFDLKQNRELGSAETCELYHIIVIVTTARVRKLHGFTTCPYPFFLKVCPTTLYCGRAPEVSPSGSAFARILSPNLRQHTSVPEALA
jgi:hypothetical protein